MVYFSDPNLLWLVNTVDSLNIMISLLFEKMALFYEKVIKICNRGTIQTLIYYEAQIGNFYEQP